MRLMFLHEPTPKLTTQVACLPCLAAEYLAGIAFNNASLGYVHAMAHQLGGFYNLPHGFCNAILLPGMDESGGPRWLN